jgi:nicotinamidase/pyrazinamidase
MRDPLSGGTMPTALDGLLRERGVTRVVVCGLATDYCVNATALDAINLGYDTFYLEDAVAAVDLQPGDGERATETMLDAGCQPWVVPDDAPAA